MCCSYGISQPAASSFAPAYASYNALGCEAELLSNLPCTPCACSSSNLWLSPALPQACPGRSTCPRAQLP
eukprot:5344052-Ditylum_brightwellii.AAC.1